MLSRNKKEPDHKEWTLERKKIKQKKKRGRPTRGDFVRPPPFHKEKVRDLACEQVMSLAERDTARL